MKKMNWKLMAACLAAAPWVHAAEPRLDVVQLNEGDSAVLETILNAAETQNDAVETRVEQQVDSDATNAEAKEIQKTIMLFDSNDGSAQPFQVEVQPLKGESLVRSDVRLELKPDAPEPKEGKEGKEEAEDSDARPSPDARPSEKKERRDGKEGDEARAQRDEARAQREKAKAEREKARAEAQEQKARAKQLARSLSAVNRRQGGGYLGVGTSEASAALRMQLKLPEGVGLVVDQVAPGSAAEHAGLEQYDVLQKLNEQLLVNPQQFSALVRGRKPGDSITIELVREGQPIKVKATLTAVLNQSADVAMPVPGLPPQPQFQVQPQNWTYIAPPQQIQPFGGTPPPMPPMPVPPPPPVAPVPPAPQAMPLPAPRPMVIRPDLRGRQPGPSFGFKFAPSPGEKPAPKVEWNSKSNVTVEADGETIRATRNGKTWLIRITDDNGIQISDASSKDRGAEVKLDKLDKIKRMIVREAKAKKPESN